MATNNASPIPMGAMNVSLLFSAASMSTTNVSSAVMNISMNTPWVMLVPSERVVLTTPMSPGNMDSTSAPAHIAATICAGTRKRDRITGRVPASTMPRVTCHYQLLCYRRSHHQRTNRGIEQSSADSEESPHVDQETESIYQCGEDTLLAARSIVQDRPLAGLVREHQLACERKVQEHESSHKFTAGSYEVAL